jgi:hypothetical protein
MKMERELGEEMARAFRSRLLRIYNEDSQDMPDEIVRVLHRLKDVESTGAAHLGVANHSSSASSDDEPTATY